MCVHMAWCSEDCFAVCSKDERRGVYVKGLTCRQANNEEDALNMLFEVFLDTVIHNQF